MGDPLEVPIARLEGGYEQMDKRLITARMDSQFRWILGTILTTWITMITLLLVILFRL
ncbi:MAG: hypothetical protein ACRD1R_10755 [Acidobacteriota bacterium]